MTGERITPGLGITAYYDTGSSWEISDDLRLLSVVGRGSVISRTADFSGVAAPTAGDRYIVDSADPTNPGKVAIFDGPVGSEAWVYLTPQEGWKFWVEDTDEAVVFDGTDWIQMVPASEIPGYDVADAHRVLRVNVGGNALEWVHDAARVVNETVTASTYATTENDHLGGKIKQVNHATGCTVTVTASLVNDEPVMFIQAGAGPVTFVADTGVTLQAKDGNLKTNGQFSSALLVAVGSDTYQLVGDLTA